MFCVEFFLFESHLFEIFPFKFVGSSAVQTSNIMGECHDMHGQTIEQGRHYVPGPDICKYALISQIAFTKLNYFFPS